MTMDARLGISDASRQGGDSRLAEMPLVTIAWRSMKSQIQQEALRRRRESAEALAFQKGLAAAAVLAHKLRRGVSSPKARTPEGPAADLERFSAGIADDIEGAVRAAGIEILAPEGAQYDGELVELIENCAQVNDPNTDTPRIAEVIVPAVLYRGALLGMGKAVIALPAPQSSTGEGDGSGERA